MWIHDRTTGTGLWFSNLPITAQPSSSPHWWLPPFHCFLTNFHSLSAKTDKVTNSIFGDKKKKNSFVYSPLEFCYNFTAVCVTEPETLSKGKKLSETQSSASHKWVKPFPQREGVSRPHMLSVALPRSFKNSSSPFLRLWLNFSFHLPLLKWKQKPCLHSFLFVFMLLADVSAFNLKEIQWNLYIKLTRNPIVRRQAWCLGCSDLYVPYTTTWVMHWAPPNKQTN